MIDVTNYGLREHFESLDWPAMTANQGFGIYALGLYRDESDFMGLATDALTDGSDDKGIDFFYIDDELGAAYIGQSYLAKSWNKEAAPANKVHALATGVTWLLSNEVVPERLRDASEEFRQALASGNLKTIHVLYVHNCGESENVSSELKAVAETINARIGNSSIDVKQVELGRNQLQRLYESLDREILVDDDITFEIKSHFIEESERWRAVITSISGDALLELAVRYRDDLYSANIRGFLGLFKHKGNVNRGMKETVASEPESFWVYNNGITILTNDFVVDGDHLLVKGLSIINGAQTAGVLGECTSEDAVKVRVNCRFIKCDKEAVVEKIIKYNNTQNEVKSFDLRSTDSIQKRLKEEFDTYHIPYVHRRNAARRMPTGGIHAAAIGQVLCSFHGHFQIAIRQRSTIFEDDVNYSRVFPQDIAAEHIYLLQCLSDAVDARKTSLREEVASGEVTSRTKEYSHLLGHSTSKQFVIHVMGGIVEQIVGRSVSDSFGWKCRTNLVKVDREDVTRLWGSVLATLLPRISKHAGKDSAKAVRSTDIARTVIEELAVHLESFKDDFKSVLQPLRDATSW